MVVGRIFRLRVTPEQDAALHDWAGICRAVWNTGLEQRREYRRRDGWVNYPQQARELAQAKTDPDLAWLTQAPSHVLQQTLMDLDRACRAVGTWRVRWRSKDRWSPSMRFPDGPRMRVQRLSKRWGRVNLPKLGWVKFRWTRDLDGRVRSATVNVRDGQWHVTFLVEDGILEVQPPVSDPRPAVGVDRGVKIAAALSDGRMLDQTFITAAEQDRLVRLQQRLGRQHGPRSKPSKDRQRKNPKARGRRQQPSARYLRTKKRIAAVQGKVRRRRDDWLTKTARQLVREHSLVAIENLNTKGMTRSPAAKPDPDRPGAFLANQRSQKAGLNRAILGKGWGRFALTLAHQARYTGCRIVQVLAAFTSQRCHQCSHTEAGNRESQADFRCTKCGWRGNADINAACNILAAGLAVAGRASPTPVGSVNPQAA
ncbi:RNA-guided endonuclease InsQ/TnpB family protein [Nakamurella lactea]|uniref:RNA-guided endonuclease InsQ/TnpB family protein n=1 Tax=Nakamurella lactea TaxID=459515 RepID=UPI00068838CD|nr:RNA-guided endonuclease TnpB family protein [Nakamurella lactea]